jgi:hypothetical protein
MNAVIRVYNEAGNVIETHEHEGEFKEPCGAKQKAVTRWNVMAHCQPCCCLDYRSFIGY